MEIFLYIVILLWGIVVCVWEIYAYKYFKSREFLTIKERNEKYVNDCNDLNAYVDKLRDTHIGINQLDYGQSKYRDESVWNFKRPEFSKQRFAPNICNCSRTVCDSSMKQPFKYVCKYFYIKPTEESLEKFEKMLNNFESVESGKLALKKQKTDILNGVKRDIPFLIRLLKKKKLVKKLGFKEINLNTPYFPVFIFQYISSGGNSSLRNDVVFNIDNLNRFITYMASIVNFRKTVAGQRALMTSNLRKKILERDNYTCQECGICKTDEPHILLEIDHIKPLSRGGLTTEDNLQVLCWKCNRTKGNKIKTGTYIPMPKDKTINLEEKNEFEKIEKNLQYKLDDIIEYKIYPQGKVRENKMYNKERGIYPAGQYLVGRDLPLGAYHLTTKEDEQGFIQLYQSYNDFKKRENPLINAFIEEDYHLCLMESNTFLVVEDADLRKV